MHLLGSLGILLASCTKRAQYPFSSWLPAAIAAPTPVSSLVHSRTLVTAGVYLIVRNCFSQSLSLSLVGATTILLGGVVAFLGQDAKKIVALSTLSQLGLIVFTLGIGSEYLTFYHLITHAFFKRLLFMCVGILIHTTYGTQERRTGGDACSNRESILLGSVACLSISGAPLSTGANSKHGIMDSIRGGYPLLLISLFLGGRCLTILYRGKLLRVISGYKVGQSRAGRPSLPRVALIPLAINLFAGLVFISIPSGTYQFLQAHWPITLYITITVMFVVAAGIVVGIGINSHLWPSLGLITGNLSSSKNNGGPLPLGDGYSSFPFRHIYRQGRTSPQLIFRDVCNSWEALGQVIVLKK